MNSMPLCLLLVLVAVAAYLVVRSLFRHRPSFGELMERIIPPPKDPVIPGTWGECTELRRLRRNSAVFTEAADCYRRIIPRCTDEERAEELVLTYGTFVSNHQKLNRSLLIAFTYWCLGKITNERCRANVIDVNRYYATELLLLEEMSEVMDPPSIAVLEGQFLHGT